jgi:hypothetical protein
MHCRRAFAEEERKIKRDLKGKQLAEKLQQHQGRTMEACERLATYQANLHTAKGG